MSFAEVTSAGPLTELLAKRRGLLRGDAVSLVDVASAGPPAGLLGGSASEVVR